MDAPTAGVLCPTRSFKAHTRHTPPMPWAKRAVLGARGALSARTVRDTHTLGPAQRRSRTYPNQVFASPELGVLVDRWYICAALTPPRRPRWH